MGLLRFDLQTALSPRQVSERLAEASRIAPDMGETLRRLFRPGPPEIFFGTVGADSFELERNIRNRNSFLPRIKGEISPAGSGSRVSVRLSLHPAIAVFMAFWLLNAAIAAAITLADPTIGGDDAPWVPAVPILMLLFGLLMVGVGFVPEAIKARRKLAELLEAGATAAPPKP